MGSIPSALCVKATASLEASGGVISNSGSTVQQHVQRTVACTTCWLAVRAAPHSEFLRTSPCYLAFGPYNPIQGSVTAIVVSCVSSCRVVIRCGQRIGCPCAQQGTASGCYSVIGNQPARSSALFINMPVRVAPVSLDGLGVSPRPAATLDRVAEP